jgi:hypothetical protein
MHTRLRQQNTDSAYYVLAANLGRYGGQHQQRLPHVASNHARAARSPQVSVWSVEQQAGTQVQIQRHRQMPVPQTDGGTSPRLPRPHHEAECTPRDTTRPAEFYWTRSTTALEAATSAWQRGAKTAAKNEGAPSASTMPAELPRPTEELARPVAAHQRPDIMLCNTQDTRGKQATTSAS